MAAAIAVSTSTVGAVDVAAEIELRVMLLEPCPLFEIIESRPAMVVNCRSRGVATAEAMVSGLAPGRLAPTEMVG